MRRARKCYVQAPINASMKRAVCFKFNDAHYKKITYSHKHSLEIDISNAKWWLDKYYFSLLPHHTFMWHVIISSISDFVIQVSKIKPVRPEMQIDLNDSRLAATTAWHARRHAVIMQQNQSVTMRPHQYKSIYSFRVAMASGSIMIDISICKTLNMMILFSLSRNLFSFREMAMKWWYIIHE